MLSGFQHQQPDANFIFPKSVKPPQHGQKPDELCKKIRERRTFTPAPGR